MINSITKNKISDYFYFFLKYRIHISIFSLIFLITFYTQYLKTNVDWAVASSFFIWNIALYLFDRAYDSRKDVISQREEAMAEIERVPFIIFSILLAFTPILIFYFCDKPILPYLIFIPLTFLYTYPIFGHKRIKDFLLIKNLYSAVIIWPLPVIIVASFYLDNKDFSMVSLMKDQIFPLFLYVMIGEAFWDIRDVHGDKVNGVNTIPVAFGVKSAKIYLYALLIIDLLTSEYKFSQSFLLYSVLVAVVTPISPRWIFHLPPLIALYRWILSFT